MGSIAKNNILSEKKKKAVFLLLQGLPVLKIASELNVSKETIYNYMEDPDVKRALNYHRRNAVQEAKNQVSGLLQKCVERLNSVIDTGSDKDAIASIRLLFQSSGMLDDNASLQGNFIYLNSSTTIGKLKELKVIMIKMFAELTPDEQKELSMVDITPSS